jgi:hypothetical protein
MFEFKERDENDTQEATGRIESQLKIVWLMLLAIFTGNTCRENP